jgi:hypothetical protein
MNNFKKLTETMVNNSMEEIMEELYLETKNGTVPIDQKTVEKYNLEKGMQSPFTQDRIVNQFGEYCLEPNNEKDNEEAIRQDFNDMPFAGIEGDGVDQMENGFQFSTSEIIDFSQGVDSRMDENR